MRISEQDISRRTILKFGVVSAVGLTVKLYVPEPVRAWALEQAEPEPRVEQTEARVYRPGEYVRWGDRSVDRIYLTIDDCGSLDRVKYAANLADQERVKLTFFPTGKNLAKDYSLWGDIIARGHTVENHTWSHANLKNIPQSAVIEQLLKQREAVQRAAATAGINDYQQVFLRPPYGAGKTDPEVVSVCQDMDYVIAMWSSDPKGYQSSTTVDDVVRRFLNNLSNGLILLQHSNETDIAALPRIINEAKQRGYVMDRTMRDAIPTTVS